VICEVDVVQEVRIQKRHIQLIMDELMQHAPDEACGVLIGYCESETIVVEKVVAITNAKPSDRSFELDAEQHYKAWNMAEREGREIVGVYHTHPHSLARPSLWDQDSMVQYQTLWVIAGTDGIKGYEWDEGIRNVTIVEVI
jgi:proteasome lid subunit RPN8/RPN11